MNPQPIPCGRLAPSPTGALHLGNAKTFLLTWLSIRAQGGRLILRIEDLDHPKVKPEATQQAIDDLRWLGLDWDESPDRGGSNEPYIQSQRIDYYKKALEYLKDGNHVYPCICSRRDVEEAQSAPHETGDELLYPGTCRDRFSSFEDAARHKKQQLPTWRFRVKDKETSFNDTLHGLQLENAYHTVGDFPLARHPDGAGYMLAVVVDDHKMGVTEVVRGDDLLSATHRQLQLYHTFGWTPPHYIHCPLVVGMNGRRLAKRHGDTRLCTLRQNGCSPEKIVGLLAWWAGLIPEIRKVHANDLMASFAWNKVSHKQNILDENIQTYLGLSQEVQR